MSASYIQGFVEKLIPDLNDVLVIEVSADGFEKKKLTLSALFDEFGGVLRQQKNVAITADTSTSSKVFEDLLTINMTTGANNLTVMFSAAVVGGSQGHHTDFRLMIDGVPKHGGRAGKTPGVGSLSWVGPVTAAEHVIKIQWKVTGSTSRIRPVSEPDTEHAQVVIYEVE